MPVPLIGRVSHSRPSHARKRSGDALTIAIGPTGPGSTSSAACGAGFPPRERAVERVGIGGGVPGELPGEVDLVAVACLDETDHGTDPRLERVAVEARVGDAEGHDRHRLPGTVEQARERAARDGRALQPGALGIDHQAGVVPGEDEVGERGVRVEHLSDAFDRPAEVVGQISRPPPGGEVLQGVERSFAVGRDHLGRPRGHDGRGPPLDDRREGGRLGDGQRERIAWGNRAKQGHVGGGYARRMAGPTRLPERAVERPTGSMERS